MAAPSSPFPAVLGPFVIPAERAPVSITWTRTADRLYAGGGPPPGMMMIGGGGGANMAAAVYEPDYPPRGEELRIGEPGPPVSVCLIANLSSGRIPQAARAIARAGSFYLVTKAIVWPSWRGLATMDGSERPRGFAALLRVLDPELFGTTTLYVPAYFGKPPS